MTKNIKYKVSVVVPNLNGEDLLRKNLPRLLEAWEYKKNNIIEIIVVDDDSTDKSVSFLKEFYPQIRLIKHTKNRGFSAAVNTGARATKGNMILLINNDVVPERNFLEATFRHFKKKSVFAVSLHERGYGWARGVFQDGYLLHAPGKEDSKVHKSFWANGGSALFRRDLWMKLGGMDEKLLSPFYWEDLDLSYRAQKRGYEILWEPKALIDHKHETTIGLFPKKKVERIRERNQLLFVWKNLTSQILFRKHLAGIFGRAIRHPGYFRIIIMAAFRLRDVLKARKKEKKETKISDEAIIAAFS